MQNKTITLSQNNYYPSLDGWRAIAIILVFLCHMQVTFTRAGLLPNSNYINFLFYQLGHRGVEFFLALTGFMITLKLIHYLQSYNSITTLKKFYLKRIFKIIPPLFLYIGLLAVLDLNDQLRIAPFELFGTIFFFRNYISEDGLTTHLWYISLIGHFYLLWPLFFIILPKKKTIWLTILICLIIAIWRSFEFRYRFLDSIFSSVFPFEYRTDIRLDSLLWGAFFALLLEQRIWLERFQRWNKTIVWLLLVTVYLLILCFHPPQSYLLRSICIPLIVIGTLLRPTFFISKILEFWPLRWIGRISYSIYIWHVFFCYSDFSHGTLLPKLQQWPINIIFIPIISIACYFLIERPFVAVGKKLVK